MVSDCITSILLAIPYSETFVVSSSPCLSTLPGTLWTPGDLSPFRRCLAPSTSSRSRQVCRLQSRGSVTLKDDGVCPQLEVVQAIVILSVNLLQQCFL